MKRIVAALGASLLLSACTAMGPTPVTPVPQDRCEGDTNAPAKFELNANATPPIEVSDAKARLEAVYDVDGKLRAVIQRSPGGEIRAAVGEKFSVGSGSFVIVSLCIFHQASDAPPGSGRGNARFNPID